MGPKTIKCPLCDGRGTQHLHGAAISGNEFHDDPDFLMDYLNGVYEHPCDQCQGKRTTTEAAWEMHLEEEAERRVGA